MFDYETDDEKPKVKQDIKIIPYTKNRMKIVRGNQYFILDPNRYDINNLMMLIDLKKINKIEEKFEKYPDGLDRLTFIKLMKNELPTNASDPYDEINLVYGLYKLFCETDLSGDGIMQWSEFTQFMIDRVEGEDDAADPNDTEGMKEKEMIKYKRYMISEKVKDYTIHKKDIISAVYYQKIDKIFIAEYNSKILKIYNPRTGRCEMNFDIEGYFQKKILEEEKSKKSGNKKKQKFKVENVKSLTFSVLSMYMAPMNILALCLSNNKIAFFTFSNDLNAECIYELITNPLQKRVWYLKEHDIWVSTGRKLESDKYYYVYELDIDFEKDGDKINCLYNQGHWHRNMFFENPLDYKSPNYGKGHQGEILDVIEISKPLLILTACMDGKIRLFNLNEKEFLKVWKHEGGVRTLAYNPNIDTNGLILCTGFEYNISIFSTDLSLDDTFKGKLEGHGAPVICVKFLADSYMCVSVDEDAVVKIWDAKQRQCLQTLQVDQKKLIVNQLLYIKKYNRFVIYGNKMIFYDQKYRESEISKASKEKNEINYPIQCQFNKYHMHFYVATLKDIRIYSSVNGNLIYVFKKFLEQERFDNETKIRCFCFDYQYRLLYLGFSNGTVQQFNAGNGSLIKPINEYEIERDGISTIKTHHTKDVTSMFVFWNLPGTPNEDYILVTTGLDSNINMYNEKDPEESVKLRGIYNSHNIRDKKNEILCMDFSRRYNNFATGSVDGIVNIWNFELTKMEETCYIQNYRNYNAIVLKFLDPFPVLSVGYSNGSIFLWGTRPNSDLSGQCFFRTMHYFHKESGFIPNPISSISFFHHNFGKLDNKIAKYAEDFLKNPPEDISFDDDLLNYDVSNKDENKPKSYLLIGDDKGFLKMVDLEPIFKKYNIGIMEQSIVQSTFNILKTEELHAETSLIHNLQKEKKFMGPFYAVYPNLVIYESKIHNEEIVYLNLVDDPFSIISVAKDRRVKIWDTEMNIIGEIYTGINNISLAPWKFKLDWETLKKEEMDEFLGICDDVQVDFSMLKNYNKNAPIPPEDMEEEKNDKNDLFKTQIPVKKKRFKKIEPNKEKIKIFEDDNIINESYEGRFIQEMKKKIDEDFCPHGEEIGMNEMSRNVIDSVANGKDISELFQSPMHKKLKNTQSLLPKIPTSANSKDNQSQIDRKELYIEKFIKKSDDNVKESLILPLIKHEFKSNENVKFRQGETEKILAFEYYQNSYKECFRIHSKEEGITGLRANYRLMWDFVDGYSKRKKRSKIGNGK